MKRNKCNLSHHHLTTCDMGQLIPISCVEALPGDSIQHHSNVLVRVSPLAAPVMHPVTARIHHFFVPTRLVWNKGIYEGELDDNNGKWEDFITGGEDGFNDKEPPKGFATGTPGQLWDYLGVDPLVGAGAQLNLMPLRAYNLIFNEYYRDQDLTEKVAMDNVQVQNIAWEKDYLTSARPFTQKGPQVTLPLGQKAPLAHDGDQNSILTVNAPNIGAGDYNLNAGGSYLQSSDNQSGADRQDLYADLTNSLGANINDVRRAFAIQRYEEARARYGSRYTEYLRYLGVRNPADSRLQRPEFLGGGRTQLNFSEIMQTTPQDGGTGYGVGDMYGHGIAAMRSNKYRRYIEEHGYVMSLLSVRPKAMYQQAISRKYLRNSKEDWFQKELNYIGQQEVYNNEVYCEPGPAGNEVFGYQDRYMEYREEHSRVSGEFREVLDYWHMSRKFTESPVLNDSFVKCVPTKRIHNVQTENALWILCQNKMVARRIVPRNAAPKIL